MSLTHDYEGMIAETTVVTSAQGDQFLAYLARPQGPGPFPAVVLFHHLPGWDEFYRETARRFAHHGYIALSPDLYHRDGNGEPDDVAAKIRAEGGIADDRVIADARGSFDFIRNMPNASGKLALFGTCSGARHAYLVACRTQTADAIVNCWGGRIVTTPDDVSDKQPVPPVEYTAELNCPVLGLFGNDDSSPTPGDVDVLEAALTEHGKTHEFHRYDGAGHGFFYYDRPAVYRAEAAVDGWAKVWSFLSRTVG